MLFFVVILSCKLQSGIVGVKHVVYKGNKYKMDVTRGYHFNGFEAGVEKENVYIYPDSVYLYITDFKHNPNENNIKALGDSVFQFRFQNEDLTNEVNKVVGREVVKVVPDTFELCGIDKNGKYWKDLKVGKTSVGYSNVP